MAAPRWLAPTVVALRPAPCPSRPEASAFAYADSNSDYRLDGAEVLSVPGELMRRRACVTVEVSERATLCFSASSGADERLTRGEYLDSYS